jgi:hypothetical protein
MRKKCEKRGFLEIYGKMKFIEIVNNNGGIGAIVRSVNNALIVTTQPPCIKNNT